jgi:predicted outer membrane protein
MSATPKLRIGIAAAGLSCLFAGYVLAQQLIDQPREGAAVEQQADPDRSAGQIDRAKTTRQEYTAQFRGNQPGAGMQSQEVQKYIAGCLLSKNKAEVEINEFAQQQAQNPEVKEFARQMVQDHQKLVQELQQLASKHGGQAADRARTTTSLDATDATEQADANARTRGAANSNSAVDQLMALEQQITKQCTQALRDELQQKQGAEFDMCYIGSQIGAHMQMAAALEVLAQQGPEQIQQVAQKAQPIVQQHLDHAKNLAKQLESQSPAGNRAARQPADTQRE